MSALSAKQRRGLLANQLPQDLKAAESLVSGAAEPRSRKAAESKPEHRVGTLTKPYVRGDTIATVKFNVNLNIETVERLRRYTLTAELRGVRRNEWIEAALEDAIARGFMPARGA